MPTFEVQSEFEDDRKRGWVIAQSNDTDVVLALLSLHMRKIGEAKLEARLLGFHDLEDDFEQAFDDRLTLNEQSEFEVIKFKAKKPVTASQAENDFEVVTMK